MAQRGPNARWPLRLGAVAGVTLGLLASNGGALARESPLDGLVSQGGPVVSVVVRAEPGSSLAAERAVAKLGGTVDRRLGIINGFSASVHGGDVAPLRASGLVRSITSNDGLELLSSGYGGYEAKDDPYSLYNLGKAIGARDMWALGATGSGVDVALIDSGVVPVNGLPSSKILFGPDLTNESQTPSVSRLDTFGHGTHMAGIIAGHDSGHSAIGSLFDSDPFMGIAPDARIVSVKVADAHGMTDVSQVIAGVDWVVQHAHDPGVNVRVMHLAFGTDSTQPYAMDPLAFAVEAAWKAGIVVVASAGNNGTAGMTMPAVDPFVIAVGAADLGPDPSEWSLYRSTVPAFSGRGTNSRNPDLVAPGVHVQSLRVPGSYVDTHFGTTGKIDDRFFRGSGTSQAAAVVSGAVALVLDQRPYLTPDQVKGLLTDNTSSIIGVPQSAQGNGVLNLNKVKSSPSPFSYHQTFQAGKGTGSLDASRGTWRLSLRGVELNGEKDIFGHSFNSATMAAAEAAGSSWSGGTWNGSSWSGSTWSGSTWSGSTWSGNDWTGSSWSGDTWSTGTWTGSTWSGSSWSGDSWSGSTWSGDSWSGSTWSGNSWTGGSAASHTRWHGASWD